MTNPLVRGADLLADARAATGVSITYTRPGATPIVVSLTAIPSQGDLLRDGTSQDFSLGTTRRDFLIDRSALADGGITEPRVGDTVTEAGTVYKLVKEAGAECWRYSDHARTQIRVFAVEVKS